MPEQGCRQRGKVRAQQTQRHTEPPPSVDTRSGHVAVSPAAWLVVDVLAYRRSWSCAAPVSVLHSKHHETDRPIRQYLLYSDVFSGDFAAIGDCPLWACPIRTSGDGEGGSECTPAPCGDCPRCLSQGSLTHVVPQVTTEEARAAEHSVHWLRPPNGIDREASAMMMDLADHITATMPISEALREG